MAVFLVFCSSDSGEQKEKPLASTGTYLNHNDTVRYVGMQACRQCHADKFDTYHHTGMGMSFDAASRKKSSAKFEKHFALYDKHSDFWYHPFWDGDSMKILEFRLSGKDTVYKRTERVDYIIGSGQHTNSHIFNTGGYLHQMPMTFYTQEGKWDLPPGFEGGFNTRFSRKIGLECMTCHNAYPQFVKGSENKYEKVPDGIDCERCHGPGQLHVQQMQAGKVTDITKEIDYTIVNPGKLPVDLQFDVCQRCHLQGNAVLKEGRSFYDFKPGMRLSDFWSVFLPKYENAEDEFIMASHADRLKQSQCFIKTFKPGDKSDSLQPYKQALTCVTCHNPHVSVKQTGKDVFNNACKGCHGGKADLQRGISGKMCTEKQELRNRVQDNCVSCHMPRSGSVDIPHVTVTDHFIRVPVTPGQTDKIKTFVGLYAINEPFPPAKTKAKAYIQQYEKFEYKSYYLDSAKKYLPESNANDITENFELLVQYYFLRKNYPRIMDLADGMGQDQLLLNRLVKTSWDNGHAWTCYRIGEAYSSAGKYKEALKFFGQADKLAPYNPEFKNKLGVTLVAMQNTGDAKKVFGQIIAQDSKFAPAYCNLGYIYLVEGEAEKAREYLEKSLALDPDYGQALLNMAQYHILKKEYDKAKKLLLHLRKKEPANLQAKTALEQLAKLK
ncbi:MAG: tetratricopeptide repeat protein [Bacteroidota bacterium]